MGLFRDQAGKLRKAARKGRLVKVARCLKKGADVNAKGETGLTALHEAASHGHAAVVELLIDKGAEMNAKDANGYTPLHSAVLMDLGDVAQLLIARGADVNARTVDGETPLHDAACSFSKDMAELLIGKGADVNSKDASGSTPLHNAAFAVALETARLLIDKGADVNATVDKGEIKVTTEGKETTMPTKGFTPLHMGSFTGGDKDIAGLLIANGADVNAKAGNGFTPLHTAAFVNAEDIAQFLIAHGADVKAKTVDGATPLDIANQRGQMKVAEVIKKHERDIPQKKDADIATLVSMIGRRDLLGPPTHLNKLLEYGDRAVPSLIPLLDSGDLNVVAETAKLLGRLGARQVVPKLLALSKSQWAEVHYASLEALALIDKKTAATLELDCRNPFEQIGRLWTAIIQGRQELYPPATLQAYCAEAVKAMPSLKFASTNDEARAWGMLGSLYFKSLNPEWPGGFDGTKSCPEAKRCYEEALRCEPGDSWWEGWIKRFS